MDVVVISGRTRVMLAAVLALSLVVAACGDTSGDTTTSSTLPQTSPTQPPVTEPPATEPPATRPPVSEPPETTSTSTTMATTTTTTAAPTTTTLPGVPIDLGWPRSGDVLAVVGVAHDDVLNVRAVPGVGGSIVATLSPTADDVVAGGRARTVGRSIWVDVTASGTPGWANLAFLAFLGSTDDATAEVVAALGAIPAEETMQVLGMRAAEALASSEPPSSIVMSVAPSVRGALGEVTFDVIALGDDSIFGLRLHVFGQPDDGGEGFSLETVERTFLCGRGVTSDGLCI